MTLGSILVAALVALIAGLVVALVGSVFDKTPRNQYAWLAGGVVALLVFLLQSGLANQ